MADQETVPPDETTTLRPWPQLGPAAYHGVTGDLIRALEPASEADPVAILVQFLVAFGNSMNRTLHMRVEAAEHCVNLFAVIIGLTSKGRKGTSWEHVLGFMRLVDEGWSRERVMGGLASGEGLIAGVRDEVRKKQPIRERGRVTDYQDVVEDEGVTDKRLLVIETEFAKVLRAMKRESSTLSATVRQAWDTGHLRTLTRNSPLKATDAHISIIAHISADELQRELEHTEMANGFLNRFLLVCARRSKCLPEGGVVPRDVLERLARRVRSALDFGRRHGEIHRTPQARARWYEVYAALSAGRVGLLGAATNRAEAQVVRLSCLYAALDQSPAVALEHLEAGLAVWQYCEDSARFVFGEAIGNPDADDVLEGLRKAAPGELSRTEISKGIFRGNKTKTEIDRALRLLHDNGLAAVREEPTSTKPRQLWSYRSFNSSFAQNNGQSNSHREGHEIKERNELSAFSVEDPPLYLNQAEDELNELSGLPPIANTRETQEFVA